MSPNAALSLISTETRALGAAWRTMLKERFEHFGRQGYLVIWAIRPIFDLAIAALIYAGGNRDLIPYLVVAMTANAFVWNALFWVGEILDRERVNGTLVPLFLTPCSRLSWLLGFSAAGLIHTLAGSLTVFVAGSLLFGVRFDPNALSLLAILPLYVAALLGLGLIMSALGLWSRRSNALANLISPVLMLLGGSYYPVERLPDILRLPARALPLGYAMEALSNAALNHASVTELAPSLLPLAGFALILPLIGALTFRTLERHIRRQAALDLS